MGKKVVKTKAVSRAKFQANIQAKSKPSGDGVDEISSQLSERIRELRGKRNWSLEALATASGVSRSMLSQIERNEANPTLAVTLKIAQAFGLQLSELVESSQKRSAIEVVRASDKQFYYRSDDQCQIRTLSPLHLEKDVEFYEVRLKPHGELKSAPHFAGTREFLTVEKGNIEIVSGEDVTELSAGDSATYRADVSHRIRNQLKTEAILFLVVIYART